MESIGNRTDTTGPTSRKRIPEALSSGGWKRKGSPPNSQGQPPKRDSGIYEERYRTVNLAIHTSIQRQDRRSNCHLTSGNTRWTIRLWSQGHAGPGHHKAGRNRNSKSGRTKPPPAYGRYGQIRRQHRHYLRKSSRTTKQTQRTI